MEPILGGSNLMQRLLVIFEGFALTNNWCMLWVGVMTMTPVIHDGKTLPKTNDST